MLVNRLRVAFGPPMMVMAAALFGPRTFPIQALLKQRATRSIVLLAVAVLFCLQVCYMWSFLPCIGSDQGICNQLGEKKGNDGALADLMSWVNEGLPSNTSVLCSMNLAGTMRAFTNVPMIVHPQFESENLRNRVQQAYELYHCGSEESFTQTMRKLHAKVVIFEYQRCFFTPYYLDDKRKNCNDQKHQTEDLLCLKLHAKSRFFKLLFMNGGYGVFELRDEPLPLEKDSEKTPAIVAKMLEKRGTWKDYIDDCMRTQPTCGARLVEAAAIWGHSLKKDAVASTLRHLAHEKFPEDGYVNYAIGRHLDYEANKAERAGHYYEKAAEALPNNVGMVKEYLMWIDMVAKDNDKAKKLILDRYPKGKKTNGAIKPFKDMDGCGSYELLCEAGVSAMQQGLHEIGKKLWDKSIRMAPLANCIKNNWEFVHPNSPYVDTYTESVQVWHYINTGSIHEVSTHHHPGVRFLGDVNFTLVPTGPTTVIEW